MKKEYLHYKIEELVDNSDFIAWVVNGTHNELWEQFLSNHPDFEPSVNEARRLIEMLRDQTDNLKPEDFQTIWKNIESFDQMYQKERKLHPFKKAMRYAAIFVGLLVAGASAFYFSQQKQPSGYVFNNTQEEAGQQQSQIVLADGTTVPLESESSDIAMTGNEQLIIDSTRVIDMKQLPTDPTKMNEVVIPYGKRSKIVLADGTKVWLNAGSRLAFPNQFNGKERKIFLEGEAYFEVAHNAAQPFIVNTEAIAVKVLGTKFNLTAYSSESVIETTLLEGKVAMRDLTRNQLFRGETILTPNQKGSFNKEQRAISVQDDPDADLSIAWIEGWLEFHQQPLNRVMSKLERYYNVKFIVEGSAKKQVQEMDDFAFISGKLDLKDSLESVLMVLSDVSGMQYEIQGNQINVSMKPN
ncbi:FecR family protein [Mangrovibacterium diazotrophicum]|uniref:FecR family protein n=1 Tax=Mangrovibacterium diazotrophicum TaxID=1261403 RepID=A0A419W5C1_9BACT|nr:FecR domain-containing protein [Mangrovibacterium diazotrophicum]RKD90626.1 FecR family protein [Mangrovibacterium diazotrophicum]